MESIKDGRISLTIAIHVKYQPNRISLLFINDEFPCIRINVIAQRGNSTGVLALYGCLAHSFHYLSRKVLAVVLAHAFKDSFHHDAFGGVVKIFKHTVDSDAIFLQLTLIYRRIISVTRKAVKLMYQENVKGVSTAILYFEIL